MCNVFYYFGNQELQTLILNNLLLLIFRLNKSFLVIMDLTKPLYLFYFYVTKLTI